MNACHNRQWLLHLPVEMNRRQQQFMQLYEPVHDRFERFCRARVYGQMDHRDLVNETLLIAYKKFDQVKSQEVFPSFLFGIAVNILSNYGRKKKEFYFDNTENQILSDYESDASFELEGLYKALARLPKNQGESLILYEISGFSVREIANLHHVSEAVVRQWLVRGRKRLSVLLKEDITSVTKNARS